MTKRRRKQREAEQASARDRLMNDLEECDHEQVTLLLEIVRLSSTVSLATSLPAIGDDVLVSRGKPSSMPPGSTRIVKMHKRTVRTLSMCEERLTRIVDDLEKLIESD